MDGWMDGWMDIQTDRHTQGKEVKNKTGVKNNRKLVVQCKSTELPIKVAIYLNDKHTV